MPRNLVLAFDGTNNQFGLENTNVVRLVQALDHNPATERIYYDPGVGTLPEPGVWSRVGQFVSKVFGLAFGGGIFWKVGEAYQYLMAEWQPGDRVYLFGFSRGAYTARLVAAVTAQAPVVELYDGKRLRLEFARTESRLIEMQSREYLAEAHRLDSPE